MKVYWMRVQQFVILHGLVFMIVTALVAARSLSWLSKFASRVYAAAFARWYFSD